MEKKENKKNFVLDTNVILHDYKCIENFQENDIYIPIAVLEELDKFKKGSDQLNYNARAFIRELDRITSDKLSLEGVSLGEGRGTLFIVTDEKKQKKVTDAFPEKIADHRILSCAYWIAEEKKPEETKLITKDINLRMKAKALAIPVEDYFNDKVVNVDIFKSAQETYENIDPDLIDGIYASHDGIDASSFDFTANMEPNACFILKSIRNSVLARYNPFTGNIKKVEKGNNYGIQPRNAEQCFAFEVMNDPEIKLVGITGKAGTGKTLLALASALKQADIYKQILLARPIVSLANKDIGFLPGTEKDKIAPYMQPLFDNLNVIKSQFSLQSNDAKLIDDLQKSNRLVIEALAFIRGRSLSETICIVDEAQNLTPHEIKTIITRTGEGTKMIFTGDIHQIDSPYLDAQSNGLAYMVERMKGQDIFAHVNLIKGERSRLAELASDLL